MAVTRSGGFFAIVVVAVCVIGASEAIQKQRIDEFNIIYTLAQNLESSGLQVIPGSGDQQAVQKRREALQRFAPTGKAALVNLFHTELCALQAAYGFEAESTLINHYSNANKNSGWFSKFPFARGNNLSPIRSLSLNDAHLHGLHEEHEKQGKLGLLSNSYVRNNMNKYYTRGIFQIVYVLASEVKYLVVEEPYIYNEAIFKNLEQNRFASKTNFFQQKLTERQKKLILDFLRSNTDISALTVNDVDVRVNLQHIITGRLLENCASLNYYMSKWDGILKDCGLGCQNDEEYGLNKFQRYQDVKLFCKEMHNHV